MTPPRHPQPPFVGVDLSAASAGNVPGDFRVHSQSDGQFRGVRGAGGPRRPGILCVALRAGRIDSLPNLARPAERAVVFYNQRGTCEQFIKQGKGAVKWTRLSCRTFAANAVRLQLHALAYNLGKLHAHAGGAEDGAAVVADQPAREADQDRRQGGQDGPYVTFQMAEVAVTRQMFQEILSLIARLRAPAAPA